MQTTIKKEFSFSGIALHTGLDVHVTVHPAAKNTGINFFRKDKPGAALIPALAKNVVDTSYATTIGLDNVTVATIEHLMAALYGMGVDNALVEIDGPEVPIMDGSAVKFAEMIEEVGIMKLRAPRKYLVIKKAIKVSEGDKVIDLLPHSENGLTIDYSIDFKHPSIAEQNFSMPFTSEVFRNELAMARTFGFLSEVEKLKANGLARGGCLSNAIVMSETDILNEEGLRFPDEFVRHKVLDIMGDLALLGARVVGRINASRAGHNLNHRLAKKVLKKTGRWVLTEMPVTEEVIPAKLPSLMVENFATA